MSVQVWVLIGSVFVTEFGLSLRVLILRFLLRQEFTRTRLNFTLNWINNR